MRAHVDLPTLDALDAEWRLSPPVHHLVAAYLGYKPPAGALAGPQQQQALQQLVAGMPVQQGAPTLDDSAWRAAMTSSQEPAHG